MALAIFSDELLPQYFTENTRHDLQLSAGRTKIASKGKSSRLHTLKIRRIMAERWMERNLPRQVMYTALEKGSTRVSKGHHARITQVSREQMSPKRQCEPLSSNRKEIRRILLFSTVLSVPQCFNQFLAPCFLVYLPRSTNV